MAEPQKVTVRKNATKRDVYWCFGISILMSVLALLVGVGRSQQLADERVRDNNVAAQLRADDQAATQAAQLRGVRVSVAQSNYDSCVRSNAHDGKLLSYIDAQVERGVESLRATLASPTSTDDQKRTAIRNLAGAAYQRDQLHTALKPEPCTKPKE